MSGPNAREYYVYGYIVTSTSTVNKGSVYESRRSNPEYYSTIVGVLDKTPGGSFAYTYNLNLAPSHVQNIVNSARNANELVYIYIQIQTTICVSGWHKVLIPRY